MSELSRFNRDVRRETSVFNRDVTSQRHASTVTFEPEPSFLSLPTVTTLRTDTRETTETNCNPSERTIR